MSVLKLFRARTFLATLSVLVVLAGVLFGARVAVADSVWFQSYQRASQTEACAAQVGETPWQASWGADSSWKPSWEQWANGGNGGWVCSRSITWAETPVAGGASSCATGGPYALGDIGPGCGLVFLISSGLTYEMAPKTWGANETTGITWCDNPSSDVTGAVGTAVGTGSANTTAIDAACTSGAGQSAADYSANGLSDWFLPSQNELNAMYNYSLVTGFPTATYGFASDYYWSSSQDGSNDAWSQILSNGYPNYDSKSNTRRVRPVRAF